MFGSFSIKEGASVCVCVCVLVAQSCPTPWNSTDGASMCACVHVCVSRSVMSNSLQLHRGGIRVCVCVCVCVLVAQSCPTLCNSTDCSLPGFSVHGILQAGIPEWTAIPFSRGVSQPRDETLVSCIAGRFFTVWATGKCIHLSGCIRT